MTTRAEVLVKSSLNRLFKASNQSISGECKLHAFNSSILPNGTLCPAVLHVYPTYSNNTIRTLKIAANMKSSLKSLNRFSFFYSTIFPHRFSPLLSRFIYGNFPLLAYFFIFLSIHANKFKAYQGGCWKSKKGNKISDLLNIASN